MKLKKYVEKCGTGSSFVLENQFLYGPLLPRLKLSSLQWRVLLE